MTIAGQLQASEPVATTTFDNSDPLDPHVANRLRLLRDQLIERLSRGVRRVRREAIVAVSIGLIGGVAAVLHQTLLGQHPWLTAETATAVLSLSASTVAAVDLRRLRSMNVQIESLASSAIDLIQE